LGAPLEEPSTHVCTAVGVGYGPPAVCGQVVTTEPAVPGLHEALGMATSEIVSGGAHVVLM
jgi:hypothetical protein